MDEECFLQRLIFFGMIVIKDKIYRTGMTV